MGKLSKEQLLKAKDAQKNTKYEETLKKLVKMEIRKEYIEDVASKEYNYYYSRRCKSNIKS